MTALFGAGALHVALGLGDISAMQVAAPPALHLAWTAPPECPDGTELTSRVHRLLGGGVKSQLTATTDVMLSGGVYRARLRLSTADGSGERLLESRQCDTLADSVALVIALSVSEASDSAQRAQGELTERLTLAASAQGNVLFGAVPDPAVGVGGALSVEGLASLRFELRVAYYARQSAISTTRRSGHISGQSRPPRAFVESGSSATSTWLRALAQTSTWSLPRASAARYHAPSKQAGGGSQRACSAESG